MENNLYDFYGNTCREYSDRILFDNKLTYADVMKLVEERAAFLQKEGYKKGDVIGLLAVSNAEWVITHMSICCIGAIVLPLDINLPPSLYPGMLKKVGTKALFISREFNGAVKGIKNYQVSLDKNLEKKKPLKVPEIDENDIATYIYTSGTTGDPKIVMLTHANIYKTARGAAVVAHISSDDLFLCLLPLYHVYAFAACFVGPFAHGASFIYLTSLKAPDIMKALTDNQISVFPAAPLLWEMFMDKIISRVKDESALKYKFFIFMLENGIYLRKIGLSPVVNKIFDPVHNTFGRRHRFFVSGGAPLKDKYRKYYKSMGFNLVEGYGLTETTGPITLNDTKKNVLGSVGKPIPGNEAVIKNVNEDGVGEIWMRGVSVMPRYFGSKTATDEVFDENRFFNTGDLGRMDRHGNIFITGRVKNVIVLSSGKNVYPEELESYYKQSTEIEEIAVFSREIDGSERVYAVIVPANKTEKSFQIIGEELVKLNRGLPTYKTITHYAISFDKLPVNSARKILYNKVIELLNEGAYIEHSKDTAVLKEILKGQSPSETEIITILKKRFKTDAIYAKQTFADFDIDSLGLVDFTVYLEQSLNISIDIEKMKKLQTMDEVVTYLVTVEKTQDENITDKLFKSEITEKPLLFFNPVLYFWIGLIKFACTCIWKVKVINPEKLKIENNILIANHTSYLDLLWFVRALKVSDIKNTYAIGKIEVSKIKFIFPNMPVIWADYDKNTSAVFKKSSDLLRQGKSILIFPEGTRSEDGNMNKFKLGAAYLAKNSGRTIIPVTINGAFEIWPPRNKYPYIRGRRMGSVVIHDKINPGDFKNIESLNSKVQKVIQQGRGVGMEQPGL